MLPKWDNLDETLKNDEVEQYYKILSNHKGQLFFKRIFDIVVSVAMIIILSPVFIILSIAIKADSRGPILYKQSRVTKNNREFKIFKFRTMVQDADKVGSLVTVEHDARITKIGEKIRKVRLDELPQLLNILRGEMSFVGTRPEVRKYVDFYDEEMKATLLLPAGVTSLASIEFKDEDEIISEYTSQGKTIDEAYIEKVLPKKMKYNLKGIEKFSFIGEIWLMFKTIFAVSK